MGAALAVLAALVVGRIIYPVLLERRARRRRPLGPDGIIVGAAAITLPRDNAPAVLLLHGGGDTPQVLAELAQYLHKQGFAARVPLLGAHGRSLAEFSRASSTVWQDEVEREFALLGGAHTEVYVVGLSMGGALAVALAKRRPEIAALVLLAPYIDMSPGLRGLARTSGYWGWLLPYLPSMGHRSIHDRAAAARGLGHGIMTPAALRGLYEAMSRAVDALPDVRVPTLVIQSREDNRVPVASAEKAFARLGSPGKHLVWVEGAGHAITVDCGRERVFELVADWLRSHQKRASPAPQPEFRTSGQAL